MNTYRIAVLAGDGIGPEIMAATLPILRAAAHKFGFRLDFEEALVGGAAIDAAGKALPEETLAVCRNSQAILFGAVGGPRWEALPAEKQPERAALLPLRRTFGLYANLRPISCYPELLSASPLKTEIARGVDLLVVRELTGGLYFGQPKGTVMTDRGERAIDTLVYETAEIERVARVAFEAARARKKFVTLVDKANVLESSLLWRKTVRRISADYTDVQLGFLYVDNAAMQLVRNPRQFDVLLCENLFGDILSDEAAALCGSLGMLPSASLGKARFGLYEPAGGSAPDIAGKGIANPSAEILCAALLLRYSLGEEKAARAIESAFRAALSDGFRTPDIASDGGKTVGTEAFAQAILDRFENP
ncbi:MAG: 3-isopropylmalate dehydrogenase [Methylacidiphilaceae bacterium]|nr:3-isopropylmalate dehydrogenase [Candidatus Methylacidiphilaceae bacterium]